MKRKVESGSGACEGDMDVTSVISLIIRVDLARQMSPNSNHTTCILPEVGRTTKKTSQGTFESGSWGVNRCLAEE